MEALDCIIVGYNDIPFHELAEQHRPLGQYAATYHELKANSVLVGGQRKNYMELLNHAISVVHGQDPEFSAFEVPNLGAVYLASFLRRRGFDVELVNFFNLERNRFRHLLLLSPRAVAITTTYYVDERPIKNLIEFARAHSDSTQVIVGGPYVHNLCAAYPERVQDTLLRSLGADIYIHDSQGESTLALVLAGLRDGRRIGLEEVPNLIIRNGQSMKRTRRVVEDNALDENAIDWRFFKPEFVVPTTYVRTARSCPFSCAFCNYPAMSGPHTLADLETIRRELRYLASIGVKQVVFIDDTFNVPLPRFKKLCQMLIDEALGLRWISFFRCANADDACFDLMARSGCMGVFLGIESGDDRMLVNMNKHAAVRRYQHGIRQLHDRGIITLGSFIVGYPGETEESVMNTVRFLEETPPTFFTLQLYYHDPLAPINRRREEWGIEGLHYNWRHKTMTWEEAAGWVEYMVRSVTRSTLLTLYGFSIWSIPYLLDRGLALDQIKAFALTARRMLVKSLDDEEKDCAEEYAAFRAIFGNWTPPQVARLGQTRSLMRWV